ncbi:MAG: hypothetical protein IPG34_14705 [Rhodocyclaceae bacterium]|nr:hypothetical protein [Rhodocyclaceae bacterium]
MELRLHADRAGLHEKTPWVLLDWTQNPIQSGHGIATVPNASSVRIIVPDDCLYVVTLTVPALPKRRIILALPGLLEEHILVPAESAGFALLAMPSPTVASVAVYYRGWLDAMMAEPVVARARSVRVVAESWGLPRNKETQSLHFSKDRFVLALPHWAACTGANTLADEVPQHLLIVLRETVKGAIARSVTELGSDPNAEVTAAEAAPLAIDVYCSSDLGDHLPPWLNNLGVAIEQRGVLDWISASYDEAPNLSWRSTLAIPKARIIRAVKPAVIMLALLCSLEFIFVATDWLILTLQRKQLMAQQESVFRSVMGQHAPMINGEVQLRRKLEMAQAARAESATSDLLVLMTRLGAEAGNVPPLDELRYESGQLFLKAKGTDDEAAWIAAARSAGLTATLDQRDGKRSIKVVR